MPEIIKNLVYVTSCSFIIIISHDLILACIRKPLDQCTWLPFSFTASVLYAICAGLSVLWELASYIKWIYFTITIINALVFGMDSLNILWYFRQTVHDRTLVLPSERPSIRPSINITNIKLEDDLTVFQSPPKNLVSEPEPQTTQISIQKPITESMHSVAIQCDSLEQMDLNGISSDSATSRYMPITLQTTPVIPPTIYTHYHKRKRHGCHGCHACDPINTNITGNYNTPPTAGGSPSSHLGSTSFGGGAVRPATTTSTYGGTFHVSKDIAPLSSPAGSGRQNVAGTSAHKMKSPWTNESLYVWDAKPTRFGDDGDEMMKRY